MVGAQVLPRSHSRRRRPPPFLLRLRRVPQLREDCWHEDGTRMAAMRHRPSQNVRRGAINDGSRSPVGVVGSRSTDALPRPPLDRKTSRTACTAFSAEPAISTPAQSVNPVATTWLAAAGTDDQCRPETNSPSTRQIVGHTIRAVPACLGAAGSTPSRGYQHNSVAALSVAATNRSFDRLRSIRCR